MTILLFMGALILNVLVFTFVFLWIAEDIQMAAYVTSVTAAGIVIAFAVVFFWAWVFGFPVGLMFQ